MARKRSLTSKPGKSNPGKSTPDRGDDAALRHVLVVGGTVGEWDALSSDVWATRRIELAKAAAHAGATWLTLRPYGRGPDQSAAARPPAGPDALRTQRLVDVREGCTVIVDPAADGRRRLLSAVEQLKDSLATAVDEAALTAILMSPAPCEPDLTIVLGPPTRLPPSLVWELAYSEIVFIDTAWDELAAAHVERATDEFSRRHRRFGGIE